MKSELERLLREALRSLVHVIHAPADESQVVVERARDPAHGDFASNIAMRLAKAARKNPRELAQAIVAALPRNSIVASAEIAGAGFINFRLAKDAWIAELKSVAEKGDAYGRSRVGGGRKVMVEFVSANPTGPMHVGHGRGAAYGATLGNLLDATGHIVYREYYINDAGRQIDILAVSVYLRYLELCGESLDLIAVLSKLFAILNQRRLRKLSRSYIDMRNDCAAFVHSERRDGKYEPPGALGSVAMVFLTILGSISI